MFARELAHRYPEKVRAVVTLGSPFSGDLKTNTNVREFYERIAGHDVNEPPFPRIDRQAAGADAGLLVAAGRDRRAAAPRAGLDHEIDKAVEIDTVPHGVRRLEGPAMRRSLPRNRHVLAKTRARPRSSGTILLPVIAGADS